MIKISTWLVLVHFMSMTAGYAQTSLNRNTPSGLVLSPAGTGPEIQVDTSAIDWGLVTIGSHKELTLAIKNIGDEALAVAVAIADTLDNDQFGLNSEDKKFELGRDGGTREIKIDFTPKSVSEKKALLLITSNDPVNDTLRISLSGRGTRAPHMEIINAPLKYIDARAAEESEDFKIRNSGGGELGVQIVEPPDWIEIGSFDDALEPDETETITVKIRRAGLCTRPPYRDTLIVIARDNTATPARNIDTLKVALNIDVNNPSPKVNADFNQATIVFNDSNQVIFLALDSIFTDLNFDGSANENLDYKVKVDTAGIIAWERTAHKLKVISQRDGLAEVTLTADDNGCGQAAIKFFVEVNRRPNIAHFPPATAFAGEGLALQAVVTNDDSNTEVWLYYRQGGSERWEEKQMSKSGQGAYQFTTPGREVSSRGVEYYIRAHNEQGESFDPESGFHSSQVFLREGFAKSAAQPTGDTQSGYRLISFPLDLDDKNPRAVLEDDLGGYDKSKWRFFELLEDYVNKSRTEKIYREFKDIAGIAPSKAYLLLVKGSGKRIDTGQATTFLTNRSYAILLHPGFNFVGNPFNFPIPYDNLSLKSGGEPELWSYANGEAVPVDSATFRMEPFEGYFIANRENTVDSLRINPVLFPRAVNVLQKAAEASRRAEEWSVRIMASCQNARDTHNKAAVKVGATDGYDSHDVPEVLTIGEYVSVYFPHPEWQRVFGSYSGDARPSPLAGDTWEFEVVTNIHDKIELTFEGLAQVPGEFEVWLLDEKLNIAQNLREENRYSIAGPSPANPKRLQLAVGKKEYVDEKLERVLLTPASFELAQNFPNPFNPATTIRFGLPRAERVTLRIYNLLGEEVATLLESEPHAPGYHTAIWNGRNHSGEQVGSGVYVYKLQAESFIGVRKMVLLR